MPAALGGEEVLFSEPRVNLGKRFVTASTAAVVSSFSFVFVAYTDINGGYFLAGVSASSFSYSAVFVQNHMTYVFSLMLEAYLPHLMKAMDLIREGYRMDQ